MYARITNGKVSELFDDMPKLSALECAFVREVADDVQLGWLSTPDGCVPPSEPDPYAVEPEYLDLGQISIGHAERLYAAAQTEAANINADGTPGDGAATVLLEMLGL